MSGDLGQSPGLIHLHLVPLYSLDTILDYGLALRYCTIRHHHIPILIDLKKRLSYQVVSRTSRHHLRVVGMHMGNI